MRASSATITVTVTGDNSGNYTYTANLTSGTGTVIDAGAGTDVYDATARTQNLQVTLAIGGTAAAQVTDLSNNNYDSLQNFETIKGGSGNDTFSFNEGTVAYTLDGGTGSNTLKFDVTPSGALAGGVTVDMTAGTATVNSNGVIEHFTNFQTVIGTLGNDTFTGTTGADTILGQDGNDTIIATAGNDTYLGGNGTDTVDYSAMGGITADMSTGSITVGSNTHTLTGIEKVIGSSSASNVFRSGSGDDSFVGEGMDPGGGEVGGGDFGDQDHPAFGRDLTREFAPRTIGVESRVLGAPP